jgi:hypothetical protein
MRHLAGIALATVIAAALFLAGVWGDQWLVRTTSVSVLSAGGGSLKAARIS